MSPKQFAGVPCVFGPEPSSKEGEHVLPRWLLRTFSEREGPYEVWRNGKPECIRKQTPRRHTSLPGVKLPMCVAHNGVLAQRFEAPLKGWREKVFDPADGRLEAHRVQPLSLWLLKTWLLLAHPKAVHVDRIPRESHWHSAPADLWSWTVTGEDPPTGLSVWLWRRDDTQPPCGSPRRIPLPTVIDDSTTHHFQSHEFGIRHLQVAVAYHPGWPLNHPLEADGKAIRMWPPPDKPAPLDLGQLPEVPPQATVWTEGPTIRFKAGRYRSANLPPFLAGIEALDFATILQLGIQSVSN